MRTSKGGHVRAAIGLGLVLVLAGTLGGGATVSAAAPTACRVKNLDTGVVKDSFKAAVRAAESGHHLRVKGTCVGITTIGKDLKVVGLRTKRSGTPTLAGAKAGAKEGPVVLVKTGRTVSLKGLTIRGGYPCCGIDNWGTLTLRDVVVRGNGFMAGGGLSIEEGGKATLAGATVIRSNEGAWGGGVSLWAGTSMVMNDTSSIRRNTALATGGGVLVGAGATLVMNDASSIVANTSTGEDGGGISYEATATLVGVDCGVNVHGNTPLDCYERPAP